MEKAPVLTTPEDDLTAQPGDVLVDTGETPESAEEGELDTSPEAAEDTLGEVHEQLDAIKVSGELDEQRFQRESQEVRAKIEAKTKEINERKTTVDKLVKELLEDEYEATEVDSKTTTIEDNLDAMEKLSDENGTLYVKLQDLIQQRSGEAFMNMRRLNGLRDQVGEHLSAVLAANTGEDAREEVEQVSAAVEVTVQRLDEMWDDFNTINSQTVENMSTLGAEKRKVEDARTSFLRATAIIAASDKVNEDTDTSVDTEALKKVQQTLDYGHTSDLEPKWKPPEATKAA